MAGVLLQPHTHVYFKWHTPLHTHAVFTHGSMFLHTYMCMFVYVANYNSYFTFQLSYNATIINTANVVAPYKVQATLHHAVEDKVADELESRSLIGSYIVTTTYIKKVLSKSHHRRMTDAHMTSIIYKYNYSVMSSAANRMDSPSIL